jgi:type IV pilus assembly protein PilN
MIKVNLLATNPGTAPARDWLPRDQRSALGALVMLLITFAGVGGWWFYQHHEGAALDTRIAAAETELARLKEAAKLVDLTTARKNELAERLSLIERLRVAKRAPVSLLETVSRSMPEGLWLLEMKQAGATVQIDGRATSLTAVTDFTERLQDSGYFLRPVEILTTSTESIDDTTVVRFSVKADAVPAQPPAGTASAPASTGKVAGLVPAHAGV